MKHVCQCLLCHRPCELAYFPDLFFVQFGFDTAFTKRNSAFGYGIPRIIQRCPAKEMCGIDTRSDIALMADKVWCHTCVQAVYHAMCEMMPFAK